MNREYHRWFSPHLHRDMELLVFGHAGARVLVFPTREGRFYDYENWGMVDALSEAIAQGRIQLFCVDSLDSETFYSSNGTSPEARISRHKEYEQYILNEVVPLMRSNDNRATLVAHGCSIGAYHAITIALRHPGLFGKVVALSGRYDLTRPVGPFTDLFGGYYDREIYFFMPTHFLPQLAFEPDLEALRQTEIILAVGEEDAFRASTEELSLKLWNKGVGNSLYLWQGEAHRPRYWREMARSYL